ncbi:TPA: TrkA family potassium uptake protein [Candidatus Poribacteria bacterium]|nr:TrkA family potassium uptake protein [Candidatus Poribacteria bacterium]
MQKFAVIGLGRFGSQLVISLAERNAEVIAIDKDMQAVEQIKDIVTYAVRLDSADKEALLAQGIDEVDTVIVAIGDNFEANVLTAALLKNIGVKTVIARAASEIQKQILELIGVDRVIFPEAESGIRLAQNLTSRAIWDYVPLSGDRVIAELRAPKRFWNKTLREAEIRRKYGINIIAIKKRTTKLSETGGATVIEESIIEMPEADYIIEENDILIVVGSNDDIENISKFS